MGQQRESGRHEPSPLRDNPLYDVAYMLPTGTWHTHPTCSPWATWWLVKTCIELERPCRVKCRATGEVWHGACVLDLFSYRLSGRCGAGTEE